MITAGAHGRANKRKHHVATTYELDQLPRTMHVGPFEYSIAVDAEAAFEQSFLGKTTHRTRRIQLDPRQAGTELPQTLVHEALHAIGATFDIPMITSHSTDANDKATDKIDLLATALLVFLRANRDVVEYLMRAS
jgi:hypothetical protein